MGIATNIKEIVLIPIEIEVESIGKNEYRCLKKEWVFTHSDVDIWADIEVYADGEKMKSFDAKNIRVWGDDGEIKITDQEHEHLYNKIEESIEIGTWN